MKHSLLHDWAGEKQKRVPLMSKGDLPRVKPLRTFPSAELELSLQKWRRKSKEHQCQAGPGMKLRFSTCKWNHHGCLSTHQDWVKGQWRIALAVTQPLIQKGPRCLPSWPPLSQILPAPVWALARVGTSRFCAFPPPGTALAHPHLHLLHFNLY